MATRKIQRRNLTKIPIGDMRETVIIYRRRLKPPAFGSNDACEEDSVFLKCRASVENVSSINAGERNFNGVNVGDTSTHKFSIRYKAGITDDMLLEFNGDNYQINMVVNLEGRNKFLVLRCELKGDASKAVNQ